MDNMDINYGWIQWKAPTGELLLTKYNMLSMLEQESYLADVLEVRPTVGY